MNKPIPTKVHGILDYLFGVGLLLAPNIFGFEEAGGAAVWAPRLVGIIALVQSLMTRYELGLLKVLPMRMHLVNDYLAGAFLAASPWLLGFYNPANERVWVPHVVAGVATLLITMLTQKEPRHGTVTHNRPAHA